MLEHECIAALETVETELEQAGSACEVACEECLEECTIGATQGDTEDDSDTN